MNSSYIFVLNIALISIFQIFMMISNLSKKKPGKFWGDLAVYAVVMTFLFFEHYSSLKVTDFVLTFSVLTVLGHSFAGKYLELYYTSKVYDRYLHLFGSFSFSLLAYSILDYLLKPENDNMIYTSIFVMTVGVTIGVFFEIAEFIHDSVSSKPPKSQHGLKDTDTDLIFNMIGAVIAGVLSGFVLK